MDSFRAPKTTAPLGDGKRKVLRTYGKKRSLQTGDAQTASTDKRRRLTPSEPDLPPPAELPRQPVAPPTSNFEKGSILNYFKPCRSSSGTDAADGLSDLHKLSSTPPSSPPITTIRKAPRRLRLRPPTPILASFATDDEEDEEASDPHEDDAPDSRGRTPQGGNARIVAVRSTLQESPEASLNARLPSSEAVAKQKGRSTRSKSTAIQTTINLSTKPAFEECKACHIVYNPLHPKDVKYHAQRHKAIMRSKSKE